MSLAGWIVVGLLLVCPFYGAAETTGTRNETGQIFRQREQRSFVNLAAVVFEATRRSPLDFLYYGRWCGLQESHDEPLDAIDRCCQRHDVCYDIATQEVCNTKEKNPYTYSYEWAVTKDDEIICDTVDPCGETLCICDKMIAECIKRHAKSYNPALHSNNLTLLDAIEQVVSKIRQ